MIKTVFSVDIGTTSLKAGIISADGEVVSFFRKEFICGDVSPISIIARQWLPAFLEAWDALKNVSEGYEISAIAISGNGPTLVSEDGTTLIWYEQFLSDYKGSSLFIPRILHFKDKFPEQYEKSSFIFSGPEFLIYQLTKNAVTILPESRFEPAYWNEKMLLENSIVSSKLPSFVLTGEKCGEWAGLPVFAGGPDFIVALIGTNTLAPGKLCDRSGSSEGFNFCVDKLISAEGVRSLPSVIPGLWNVSALIPDSSSFPENIRIQKIIQAIEKLRKLAKDNQIVFPSEMAVTGGQAKDSLWMKLKQNATGMKLNVNVCPDAEILGDACCGFVGLGVFENLQQAAKKICSKR